MNWTNSLATIISFIFIFEFIVTITFAMISTCPLLSILRCGLNIKIKNVKNYSKNVFCTADGSMRLKSSTDIGLLNTVCDLLLGVYEEFTRIYIGIKIYMQIKIRLRLIVDYISKDIFASFLHTGKSLFITDHPFKHVGWFTRKHLLTSM